MIDFEKEKSLALDAQERYDIIAFAMDAADDDGFINSFIFERALCCYTAIMLYPEHKDVMAPAIAEDLLRSWKILIDNGTIQAMVNDYKETLDVIFQESEIWYQEYADYAHSARGILNMVQGFTGNIVENAAARLSQTAEQTGVQQLLEVAEDWGMNRDALKTESVKENIIEAESLFKQE